MVAETVNTGEEVEKMRVTSKGQVTIPAPLRDRLGFLPDTEVEFIVEGDTLLVRRRGSEQQRKPLLSPGGRNTSVLLTTEEIEALLGEV